jgi:biofilm PGA synthesis N-glycosyltransferase PgaC
VRAVNGWPPVAGEDVVLTWRFLERGWRVFHEPLAVAFTTEAISTRSLGGRRARAAVGLVDALREAGLRSLRFPFSRFLTLVDAAAPLLDLCFTACWLPAVVLAFLGHAGLVGWYVLFVLPLSLATSAIVRRNHNEVMEEIGLQPRRSPGTLLASALTFHAVQAPLSIWAYALEIADASVDRS